MLVDQSTVSFCDSLSFLREYKGRNELVKLKVAVDQMLQLHINKLYSLFSSCFTYYTLVKKSKGTSNIKSGLQ